MPTFYEFFSGGGLARAGLGQGWECLLANDIDPKKAATYAANWGKDELIVSDIKRLSAPSVPGSADLAWASFPCQDLSLAGNYAGLAGRRSGTFWAFWKLVESLAAADRAPRLITLENVCGALTSHDGRDFAAIGGALASAGYRFGALVLDAVHFVPQSRPRLFVVAARRDVAIPASLTADAAPADWGSPALELAQGLLPSAVRSAWIWWSLPAPPRRASTLEELIPTEPEGVDWDSQEKTRRLIGMMSTANLRKLDTARRMRRRVVGTLYRRTRAVAGGGRAQRAEIRFDGIAGCLRTPTGGSSRQSVVEVSRDRVRTRLLSPREAARLMGLPDSYLLPANYNEAYHVAGDGVVVPVVRFLAANLIEPLLAGATGKKNEAA